MYGCKLGRKSSECPIWKNGCECIDCENVFEAGELDYKDQDAVMAEQESATVRWEKMLVGQGIMEWKPGREPR